MTVDWAVGRFGFCADPDVPALLERCEVGGEGFDLMSRNAERAAAYFHVPSDRVIEVGTQVEL